jgi:hypothetical protein
LLTAGKIPAELQSSFNTTLPLFHDKT